MKPITEKLIVIKLMKKVLFYDYRWAQIKIAKKRKRYLNRFEMISYDFKNRVLQNKVDSAHALFANC